MRPIDADALRSYMDECSKESRFRVYYGYAESFINDAPTIDAVPVVRCLECKHRGDSSICPMIFEEFIDWDDDGYMETDIIEHDRTEDDGFCQYGERNE